MLVQLKSICSAQSQTSAALTLSAQKERLHRPSSLGNNTTYVLLSGWMFGMPLHREKHGHNVLADILAEARHLISPMWLKGM